MSTRAKDSVGALTEKEKQTLRLIGRGHDAKSTARSLGLSVHTINERLRDARRKMAVSSSREAARLLLDAEGSIGVPTPQSFLDRGIGEDGRGPAEDQERAPIGGARRKARHSWIIIGVFSMTFALGLLALAALPQVTSAPSAMQVGAEVQPNAVVVNSAREWLALVDQGRWEESYQATGASFRKLNTVQAWAAASERVRTPLGTMISRTFVSQEYLPAPPAGYEVVKFRTRFAGKAEALETVTLDLVDGRWRVVGVTIG